MTTAMVAFGANLGSPEQLFHETRRRIECEMGIESVRASSLYQTMPVGGPADQPPYVNGAYEVTGSFDPASLLFVLQEWQREAGRVSTDRWQPRPLDLDIVWIDSPLPVVTDVLTIPHPRMHYRWFVLKPCCDLRPDAVHPILAHTMEELCSRILKQPLRVGVVGATESDFERMTSVWNGLDSWICLQNLREPLPCHNLGDSILGVRWQGDSTPPDWVFVFSDSSGASASAEGKIVPALDLRAGWETASRLFWESIRPGELLISNPQ